MVARRYGVGQAKGAMHAFVTMGGVMDKQADQTYLVTQQYRDGANLAARGNLFELFSTNHYGFNRWLFDRFGLSARCHILELGSGTGVLWVKAVEEMGQLPAGWDITLSDLSEGMLREAQQNLRASGHPFMFAAIDAQDIPYPDASFDVVFAHFMLYHVPDRSRAIGEMRRVLRLDGHLYAATPGVNNLHELAVFAPDRESDWGRDAPFTLENGRDQLAAWFSHVETHRYEDALVVTEAEPLIASLVSKYVSPPLDSDARADLVRRVHEALAAHGVIRATKDFGLFEAW